MKDGDEAIKLSAERRQTRMNAITQNLTSSLTGNLPKAILYVRDIRKVVTTKDSSGKSITKFATAGEGGTELSRISKALYDAAASNGPNSAALTFNSLKELPGSNNGLAEFEGFLGLEVQYNPNSIYLDTVAGRQVKFSGGGLGSGSDNQITQMIQPASTTMSFQLVFDDMNPSDAFMINSISATGDLVSKVSNLAKKANGESYSVKNQIDGLLALLASDATRQVLFFWSKMCFRGEVTNVSSHYTMFSPSGHPIRGMVEMSIRQGSTGDGTGYDYSYEEEYWDAAFDRAFNEDGTAGLTSTFQKVTQNNFLNLNI